MNNKILVFTKPWKDLNLEDLAALVKEMGFDGVELPVRDGYQVNPNNVEKELESAQKIFKEKGLVIGSIAGDLDETIIKVMGKLGISILRICMPIDMKKGYFASEKELRDKVNSLFPLLESNNVLVGFQNHYGFNIGSALGVHHLLSGISGKTAGAVLDFAHCGIDGEPVEIAYDILKNHLLMVNFKSAYQFRTNGLVEEEAEWRVHWVTGKHGLYSWRKAVELLKSEKYDGYICLPAEYDRIGEDNPIMGEDNIERTRQDLNYIRNLMEN